MLRKLAWCMVLVMLAAMLPVISLGEGGTVRILAAVTGGKDEEEMKLWAAELSQAVGLTVEVERPASDYDNVLMQKLGAGEVYDLIYVGASQYANLAAQGALMDITDRVKTSAILTENVPESEWADITLDGKVYAGFNKRELHVLVNLNRQLLADAGIDYTAIEPTLEGYYQVFKALREKNPGEDFYPFDTILSQTWELQPWFASQGLKGGVVVDEADGKTFVPYATDAAAPVWEWFKKLYDEKLLDPASFVDQTKDMRSKMSAASRNIAVDVDWAAWVGLHNANALAGGISQDEYAIVSLPGTKTPDGTYMLRKGNASLFAVPANAANVDGAIKVLEYFATQEGGILLSLGVKDHDYTVSADGVYTLTEVGKTHGMDHGAPLPIYRDFKNPIGMNPGVEEAIGYLEYASVERTIPNEADYKAIVGKWAISIIKGEVETLAGLEQMRNELVAMGVCEK